MYNSTSIDLSQDNLPELAEQLSDKGRGGKERPWRAYKMANELLAMAYDDVDGKKADRLRACGKVLTFLVDEYGKKKLTNAESCRVRLCPLCTWRRSLKFQSTLPTEGATAKFDKACRILQRNISILYKQTVKNTKTTYQKVIFNESYSLK